MINGEIMGTVAIVLIVIGIICVIISAFKIYILVFIRDY